MTTITIKNGLNNLRQHSYNDYKELMLDQDEVFHKIIDRGVLEKDYFNISSYQHFSILCFRLWLEKVYR